MRTRECNSQEEEPQNLFFLISARIAESSGSSQGNFQRKNKRGRQKKTIKTQNRKEHKTYISTTYSG